MAYILAGILAGVWISAPCSAKPKTTVPDSLQQLHFEIEGVGFCMQRVEGGSFVMGATWDQTDRDIYTDKPAHLVFLSPYYIATTEVTNALWRAVMPDRETLSPKGYPTNPINYISWNDAQEFVHRLDSLTGLPFRLPTEAEWEYAARGGAQSKHYRFAGSSCVDSVGWVYPFSGNWTHPVARRQPNELGLYDMTGNVSEWCQDRYGAYHLNTQPDPCGADTGRYRIVRGGSYDDCAANSHISVRRWFAPETSAGYIGLRVALRLPDDPAMQVLPEDPPLTRTMYVKGKRLKFIYVPAETPFYISEEVKGSFWNKHKEQLWAHSIFPATETETKTAETLGLILQKPPRKKKSWERDIRSIQRRRRVNKRASAFTELFGVRLEQPDDPVLQQFKDEKSEDATLRLVLRVR